MVKGGRKDREAKVMTVRGGMNREREREVLGEGRQGQSTMQAGKGGWRRPEVTVREAIVQGNGKSESWAICYGLWGERRSEKLVRSVVGLEVCRGMQKPPLEEPKRRV